MSKYSVGMMVKCNRLSVRHEPIYPIVEVSNNPLYKLPNVIVLDRHGIKRLVTDFEIL